MLWHKNGADDR